MNTNEQDTELAEVRRRACRIARSVLAGESDLLEAALELCHSLSTLGLSWDDADFHAFCGIASECDHLPIGEERQNWASETLERKEPAVRQARAWAEEFGLPACERLLARFPEDSSSEVNS